MTPAIPDTTVYRVAGWRRLVLWPAATLLGLWGRTLRFEMDAVTESALRKSDRAMAVVLWHNRLFVTPEIQRRYRYTRPNHALVSASKDGAWLSAFLTLVGMRPIRGSSSRFGREAAVELIDALHAGHDIGITPDGPRGPCYKFRAGAITVAQSTDAPLLLIGAKYSSAWRTKSWDRFYLPKPFSKVELRARIHVVDKTDSKREDLASKAAVLLTGLSPD